MSEVIILRRTQQLLDESPIRGKDADTKIRQLLRAEYLRRLGQYRRVIQLLAQNMEWTSVHSSASALSSKGNIFGRSNQMQWIGRQPSVE